MAARRYRTSRQQVQRWRQKYDGTPKSLANKSTRPYSPWQNGKVERSHLLDNDMFYSRRRFSSYDQMIKSFNRYVTRYNNIAKKGSEFQIT